MIISETVLRSRIRSLLLEAQVYPLRKTLEDIEFYRDFEEGEFEQIEQRLRSNWDRGYSKFSQVIKKDVINTKEPIDHILDAIDSFMPYYSKVGPQMQLEIGRGDLTSSNLRGYVEGQASDKLNKTRTSQRIACRRQVPIREGEECGDFKVIHAGSDWTVVYPKTLLGSMSWAVGLADGSEEKYRVDTKNRQVGRVEWCTASYENNRFPIYAGNMHMYYFVKNSGYDISDRFRRLCITWSKNKRTGKVQIQNKGSATVDAKNIVLPEEKMLSLIGQELVEKMRVDASSRKATSLSEIASKVTLPMVKQDIENLKDDPGLLRQQLQIYAQYVKDDEVIRFFVNYEDVNIRRSIAKNKNIAEVEIRQLVQDKDAHVRSSIIRRSDLPEDLIIKFAKDEDTSVRLEVSALRNLPEGAIRQLAKDENENIRSRIAHRSDLPEDLIRQLSQDESELVRSYIAYSSDSPEDLIRQLSQDESEFVRRSIALRSDLPEDLIRQLSQDENSDVRDVIAHSKKIDLPEDLIRQMARDKVNTVRSSISRRSDLPEDVIRQLSQDKDEIVRNNIAMRRDLPKDLVEIFLKNYSTSRFIIINYALEKELIDEKLSEYIDKNSSLTSDKDLKAVEKDGNIELILSCQNISGEDLISLYNNASLPLKYIILGRKDLPSILKTKYKPEMFTRNHLEEKFGEYYIYEEEDINLVAELLALSRYVNPEVLDNIIHLDLFGDNVDMYENKGFEIAPSIIRNENATPQLKKKILDHLNEEFDNFTNYYGPKILLNMKEYLEEFLTKNHPGLMGESFRVLKSYINMLLD